MNLLTPYKLWIEIGLLVAIIGGAVIGVHKFLDYEQQIGYDRRVSEDFAQAMKDKAAAEAKEKADAKQKEVAENERTLQGQRIDALTAANTALANSLRGTSSSILGNLSSATTETARATAIAFAGIFGDCTSRYVDLAKKADGHVADIRLLQAAP